MSSPSWAKYLFATSLSAIAVVAASSGFAPPLARTAPTPVALPHALEPVALPLPFETEAAFVVGHANKFILPKARVGALDDLTPAKWTPGPEPKAAPGGARLEVRPLAPTPARRPELTKEAQRPDNREALPAQKLAIRVPAPALKTPAKPVGAAPDPDRPLGPRLVFGSNAIAMARLPLLKGAKRMFAAPQQNLAQTQKCKSGPAAACRPAELEGPWQALLAAAQSLAEPAQIRLINGRVNDLIAYQEDREDGLRVDHWARPDEIMAQQTGDCEDYAILKMWLLRQLGFSSRKMHVVIVSGQAMAQHHAVLVVRQAGQNLILDNRQSWVLHDRDVGGYRAIASINRHGSWIHAVPKGPRKPQKNPPLVLASAIAVK